MNDYNFIDREEGTNALIDGFCVAFGEKNRKTFTDIGNQLIELGMENGEKWINDLIPSTSRIYIYLKFNEDKSEIIDDLKLFFTDSIVEKLIVENDNYSDPHPGKYMKGCEKLCSIISKRIKDEDATLITPEQFSYFKKFKLSQKKQFSSVTLFSEGGLGLDEYSNISISYMAEENELFYPIESIGRKFHYFGQLLKKQDILKEYIEKSKQITQNTNSIVSDLLRDIIYSLSLDSVSDKIILDIQKETGVTECFFTHKQVHNLMKNRRYGNS